MLCGLVILGIAIVICVISVGSEESSKLYYDLVEDANDMRGGKGNKPTAISVEKSAQKAPVKKAASKADDVDTLAQDIYDSTEM